MAQGLGKVGDLAALGLCRVDEGSGRGYVGQLGLTRVLRTCAVDPLGDTAHQHCEQRHNGDLREVDAKASRRLDFTHATWAELGFFRIEHVVKLAADADAKGCLEKQQYQAEGTN